MDNFSTTDIIICTVEDQKDIRYAQDALYVLNGKWRMSIIIALDNGITQYRDIARYISGITFSMLSRELKFMERNNLITRTADPDFPKTVSYGLTEYCKSLYPIVKTLIIWGKAHRKVFH